MRWWIVVFFLFLSACSVLNPTEVGQPNVVPTVPPSLPQPTEAHPTESPSPPQPTQAPPTEQAATLTETATAILEPTAEATRPPFVEGLPDPAGYQWVEIARGLAQPVDLKNNGDERLFVVERPGTVRVFVDGALLPEPFLDISARVRSRGFEQGLLGLAFHPQFERNGRFYLYYTDVHGAVVIASYLASADGRRGDPASESVLLRIDQPYQNHNGGGLVSGPDGYLYIAVGDGGSGGDPQGNGQNMETLLGTILRIDVDRGQPYGIPADNPFANGGGRPEIWSYGLRNPWRFTFDGVTGDMYIADVGQDKWEEIDFLPAGVEPGANFGWNIREGAHPFGGQAVDGLLDPVVEYGRDLGCSVTGGVVVRDPGLPDWEGVYLYGDFCSGLVFGMLRNPAGLWESATLFRLDARISSFGEGTDGKVYLLDLDGVIYRLEAIP